MEEEVGVEPTDPSKGATRFPGEHLAPTQDGSSSRWWGIRDLHPVGPKARGLQPRPILLTDYFPRSSNEWCARGESNPHSR